MALFVSWHSTVLHLVEIVWTVDVFSHGLLVPFVSMTLIWSRRELLSNVKPTFSLLGFGIVFCASLAWLLGELIDIALFSHIGLITAINGLVIAIFGAQFFRAIVFPMLFLYLAVPFGYELVGPLQTMTANLVIGVLDLIGADYTADGVLIELPSGLYEVAAACAGVKFLFTSVVTGVLLAHLVFNSWRRRVFILVFSAILPIAANALRVLGILAVAELTDQEFAKGVDHIVYGWVFLSIVLFALIAFAYKISDKPAGLPHSDANSSAELSTASNNFLSGFAAITLPILVAIIVPPTVPQEYTEYSTRVTPLFEDASSGYRVLRDTSSISNPGFLGADDVRISMLRRDGHVFLATYGRIDNLGGPRRLHYPGNTLAGSRWFEMRGLDRIGVTACGVEYNEYILRNESKRMIAWAFYLVNGKAVSSIINEKIMTATLGLKRQQANGEVFILSAPIEGDIGDIRRLFADFLSTISSDGLLWAAGGANVRDSIICAG